MTKRVARCPVGARVVAGQIALALLALAGIARADAPSGAQGWVGQVGTSDDDQGLRLETIGYKLAQANATRCGKPEMMTGLMLHNIGGYDEVERVALRQAYDLTNGFGVLHVVPRSTAALAGVAEGDEIVAVNGLDLAGFAQDSVGKLGSYDRTERFVAHLNQTLVHGPAILDIRRGSSRIRVLIQGEKGCGGRFALLHRNAINAWSDGRYVAVTDKMMAGTPDDNELAFVIAHEMSHNILPHAAQNRGVSRLLLQFGIGAEKTKASEIEADRLAVELMASAGFDLAAPERLLRRSAKARWLDLPITHPGISRRIQIVRAALAQLAGSRTGPETRRLAVGATTTAWVEPTATGQDRSPTPRPVQN